jgi:hypothetical protein
VTPDQAFVGLFTLLAVCVVMFVIYMIVEVAVIAWVVRTLLKQSAKVPAQGEGHE